MQTGKQCFSSFGSSLCWSARQGSLLGRFGRKTFRRMASSSVDPEEIQRFEELSTDWSDEDSWFKPLHSYNKIRVPWIVDTVSSNKNNRYPLCGKQIIDVACGGGIVSVPLARLGAVVSGIDASPEVVKNAERAAKYFIRGPEQVGSIDLHCSTVEDFVLNHSESFDAVIASEVLEHVNNLEQFVCACIALARRGAPLFFTTLNKTYLSKFFAIYMAEQILKIVPSGVHDWEKFIEPSLLRSILEQNGCEVRLTHGITYNPLLNKWSWIADTKINYAMMAVKL